jgi:hypothetical protein
MATHKLPGPSSTERGLLVLKTGSLIVNPASKCEKTAIKKKLQVSS